MAVNDFTCPNGHPFKAIAKLRARCPECGVMARRSFGGSKSETPEAPKPPESRREPETPTGHEEDNSPPEETKGDSPPPKEVKVLRRGRTREHKQVAKKAAPLKSIKTHGIVTHKKVAGRVAPIVKGKPRGNKEHKIDRPDSNRPFWHNVADKYGVG